MRLRRFVPQVAVLRGGRWLVSSTGNANGDSIVVGFPAMAWARCPAKVQITLPRTVVKNVRLSDNVGMVKNVSTGKNVRAIKNVGTVKNVRLIKTTVLIELDVCSPARAFVRINGMRFLRSLWFEALREITSWRKCRPWARFFHHNSSSFLSLGRHEQLLHHAWGYQGQHLAIHMKQTPPKPPTYPTETQPR